MATCPECKGGKKCPQCHGTGLKDPAKPDGFACKRCKGKGDCRTCAGTGEV